MLEHGEGDHELDQDEKHPKDASISKSYWKLPENNVKTSLPSFRAVNRLLSKNRKQQEDFDRLDEVLLQSNRLIVHDSLALQAGERITGEGVEVVGKSLVPEDGKLGESCIFEVQTDVSLSSESSEDEDAASGPECSSTSAPMAVGADVDEHSGPAADDCDSCSEDSWITDQEDDLLADENAPKKRIRKPRIRKPKKAAKDEKPSKAAKVRGGAGASSSGSAVHLAAAGPASAAAPEQTAEEEAAKRAAREAAKAATKAAKNAARKQAYETKVTARREFEKQKAQELQGLWNHRENMSKQTMVKVFLDDSHLEKVLVATSRGCCSAEASYWMGKSQSFDATKKQKLKKRQEKEEKLQKMMREVEAEIDAREQEEGSAFLDDLEDDIEDDFGSLGDLSLSGDENGFFSDSFGADCAAGLCDSFVDEEEMLSGAAGGAAAGSPTHQNPGKKKAARGGGAGTSGKKKNTDSRWGNKAGNKLKLNLDDDGFLLAGGGLFGLGLGDDDGIEGGDSQKVQPSTSSTTKRKTKNAKRRKVDKGLAFDEAALDAELGAFFEGDLCLEGGDFFDGEWIPPELQGGSME